MQYIDWIAFITDIGKALIIAAITSFAAVFFTKKYIGQITFANKMRKYGFATSVTTNDISAREYKMIFEKAVSIRIMYVSGKGFFSSPERMRALRQALQRGADVRILLAKKENSFLNDIVNLEVEAGNRKRGEGIDEEAEYVHAILGGIAGELPETKPKVRYYSSEYRLPMIIAEFAEAHQEYALSWLHITLPPYRSQKKFLLRGREEFGSDDEEDSNLVLMMIKHFDSVWDKSKCWEETD